MKKTLLLIMLPCIVSLSALAENITINHPSPYVRMHANDAVKWQRWDRSVLQRAKKENKLIFISSGYYACHWCHVMRKESFADKKIGAYINKYFIPVKIDRELNPVLDDYLMNFLQSTQGYGGWPLNVFVTPQGYPLTGLVYLKRQDFLNVLKNLQLKWMVDRGGLNKIALSTFEYTEKSNNSFKTISALELKNELITTVKKYADELEGGFGEKAKFPMPHLMVSLLSVYENEKSQWLGEFILLTLNQMVENGLYDAFGGGFFRYTVDQGWTTPHYEKMLYTNAAMIKLYIKAYKVFNDEKWLMVAKQTFDFVIRDMRRVDGGYVSTLNAQDVSGEEGGNYLWEKDRLMSLLSSDERGWLKKNIKFISPQGTQKVLPAGFMYAAESNKIKQKVLSERNKNLPVKDDKLVISWNAYLLSAMLDFVTVSDEAKYRKEAKSLYKKLTQQLSTGLVRNEAIMPQRFFEDYAFSAAAFWQWQNVYGGKNNNQLIKNLLDQTIELFTSNNAWKKTDQALLPVPGVNINIPDANLPSADVVINKVLTSMAIKGGPEFISNRVDESVFENPLEYSSFIVFINEK